jgi:hypothetical protein
VRVSALLFRLGLADRPIGVVASRVWPHRRSEPSELAELAGLPLWATVHESLAVGRAARAGGPPPPKPFSSLARAVQAVTGR